MRPLPPLASQVGLFKKGAHPLFSSRMNSHLPATLGLCPLGWGREDRPQAGPSAQCVLRAAQVPGPSSLQHLSSGLMTRPKLLFCFKAASPALCHQSLILRPLSRGHFRRQSAPKASSLPSPLGPVSGALWAPRPPQLADVTFPATATLVPRNPPQSVGRLPDCRTCPWELGEPINCIPMGGAVP